MIFKTLIKDFISLNAPKNDNKFGNKHKTKNSDYGKYGRKNQYTSAFKIVEDVSSNVSCCYSCGYRKKL
jgi:hypothetical protein